ncbi:retrovirus-related pol polyprotein from transposon TNT 1-94 [Tanacetum coccineum]
MNKVQEAAAELDGNTFMNPFATPEFEEAKSSSNYQDPSNMQEFHQQHCLLKYRQESSKLNQVIADPSKPVTNKSILHTDAEIEDLYQFKRLDVWELDERPIDRNVIKVKWIFKNKTDAENTIIRNKSFTPVTRLEAVRITGIDFSNHVYRLKKALYGLKQAPRAWYAKLSSFLIELHFTKDIVDPTLFTRRHGDDILLVQIYVDDIIFGSTNLVFSKFAKVLKYNFEMSTMGEMKFFLGLQGEYDMWRLRIEQYFQVQDYALWDVIENGNSFKPAAKTTTNADGTSTTLIPGPVTTEEKVQKKNDMKARSMLLMALPNEHLMTFN